MDNFSFQNPTKLIFGEGQIAKIANEIPKDKKVLVIYGGGSIKRNGVYEQISAALEGHQWSEFSGIEPNPSFHTALKAVEQIKAEGVEYLLAVGGGSVADATKFIAAAACFDGDPWSILSEGARIRAALPLAVVLTLPATGSESNPNGVMTNYETQEKLAFYGRQLFPKFAVLDPTLTYSLPAKQVANGIVDAYVHTVEQYLTYPVGADLQDRFAEGILRTLVDNGPKALSEPKNYTVRANVMLSATMALNGLIGSGVPQDWATHFIGHELTALHGLDHGQTLAVILPAVMAEKREQKHEKLLQYAKEVWNISSGTESDRIDRAIDETRAFFESLGIATRLSDYGVTEQDIPAMIAALSEHKMTALGEHGDITPEVSAAILKRCL
ncbi:NADP-dependent alcohol dehydrogenase [Oceanospirillum multiglobuliferum]|uniref:NADH-dependent alcohol dehydrogenase n=1 Tax=Oceanospirillum multiglobuliferum TaxID=64969 RepID=A0A1T4NDB3_9GAMM|nr:iron-containing alcohol dehydrogenase [Oceanospirillum multiglobuliferum]OPX55921.1 NADH-dependent alcohol dehydrogenase [Oceanospirillum multiglobuliferum]SJZ77115.1 NADP-dependent alcohol dehydrogenase [Oceanospirillum multiglobuliferum]